MAETDDQSSTPKMTQREAQEALEKQVAQLKREINKINRTLSERAEEALEEPMAGMTARLIVPAGPLRHFAAERNRFPEWSRKIRARSRPPSFSAARSA